ncbi:hypothetical protein PM082_017807 [Marasmius tenuissimus]|nr:hypothetical protein PM082_017807 [Marasmius tenuissimus]
MRAFWVFSLCYRRQMITCYLLHPFLLPKLSKLHQNDDDSPNELFRRFVETTAGKTSNKSLRDMSLGLSQHSERSIDSSKLFGRSSQRIQQAPDHPLLVHPAPLDNIKTRLSLHRHLAIFNESFVKQPYFNVSVDMVCKEHHKQQSISGLRLVSFIKKLDRRVTGIATSCEHSKSQAVDEVAVSMSRSKDSLIRSSGEDCLLARDERTSRQRI